MLQDESVIKDSSDVLARLPTHTFYLIFIHSTDSKIQSTVWKLRSLLLTFNYGHRNPVLCGLKCLDNVKIIAADGILFPPS